MKEMLRYGFILASICVIATGLLAGVYSLTHPKIIAQAKAEEETSLKEVMPQAKRFVAIKSAEEILYYQADDHKDKFLGVVFKASSQGYSSVIETVVGMKKDGTIIAIKILNQNETPGMGDNITQPAFTNQFCGKDIGGLGEVQAITGSTISSKAVIDSVKEKTRQIQELIKNER